MPVIVAWIAMSGHLADGLRTVVPINHLYRGLMGTAGMGLAFTGFALLPLPEATAIGYARRC